MSHDCSWPLSDVFSQLSFFANALGLKPISADRMYQIHTGMVSKGLDMHLFFKVMHTFLAALASVGVRKVRSAW